jgi:hypothetical protein
MVSVPTFAPQIALVGKISDRLMLLKPLLVEFEDTGDGWVLASDDVFHMYGEGITYKYALADYVSSLSEYYELLESYEDAPSVELFRYIQSYLQPIRR